MSPVSATQRALAARYARLAAQYRTQSQVSTTASGQSNYSGATSSVDSYSDSGQQEEQPFTFSIDPKAKPKAQVYLAPNGMFTTVKPEGGVALYWDEDPKTMEMTITPDPGKNFENVRAPVILNATTYKMLKYFTNPDWKPTAEDLERFPEIMGELRNTRLNNVQQGGTPQTLADFINGADASIPVLDVKPVDFDNPTRRGARQSRTPVTKAGERLVQSDDGNNYILTSEEIKQINRGQVRLPGQWTAYLEVGKDHKFQPVLMSMTPITGRDKTFMLFNRPVDQIAQPIYQAAKSDPRAGILAANMSFGSTLVAKGAAELLWNLPTFPVRALFHASPAKWGEWLDKVIQDQYEIARQVQNAGKDVGKAYAELFSTPPTPSVDQVTQGESKEGQRIGLYSQPYSSLYDPNLNVEKVQEEAEERARLLAGSNAYFKQAQDIINTRTSDPAKLEEAYNLTKKAIEIDVRIGYVESPYGAMSVNPYYGFSLTALPETEEQFINNLAMASFQKQLAGMGTHLTEMEVFKIKEVSMDVGIELAGQALFDWTNLVDFGGVSEAMSLSVKNSSALKRVAKVVDDYITTPKLNRQLERGMKKLAKGVTKAGGDLENVANLTPEEILSAGRTSFQINAMKTALKSQSSKQAVIANDLFGHIAKKANTVEEFQNLVEKAGDAVLKGATTGDVEDLATLPVTIGRRQIGELDNCAKVIEPKKWRSILDKVIGDVQTEISRHARETVTRTMKANGVDITTDAAKEAIDRAVAGAVARRLKPEFIVSSFADQFRKEFINKSKIWRNSDLLYDGAVGALAKITGGAIVRPNSKIGNIIRWVAQLNNTIMNGWYKGVLSLRPAWVIRNYQDNVGRFVIAGGKLGGSLQTIVRDLGGPDAIPLEMVQSMSSKMISDPTSVGYRVLIEGTEFKTPFDHYFYRLKETYRGWNLKWADDKSIPQNLLRNAAKIFEAGVINPIKVLSEGTGDWQSFVEFSFRLRLYHTKYMENLTALRSVFFDQNIVGLPADLRKYGEALLDMADNDPVKLSQLLKLRDETETMLFSYLIPDKVRDMFGEVSPADAALFFNPIRKKLAEWMTSFRTNGTVPTDADLTKFFTPIIDEAKKLSDDVARAGNQARKNPVDMSRRAGAQQNAADLDGVMDGLEESTKMRPNTEAEKMYNDWRDRNIVPDETELRRVLGEHGIAVPEGGKAVDELEKLIKGAVDPVVEPHPMPEPPPEPPAPLDVDEMDDLDLENHNKVIRTEGQLTKAKDDQWSDEYKRARDAELLERAKFTANIRENRTKLPTEIRERFSDLQLDISDWMDKSRKLIYALFPFSDTWDVSTHRWMWKRFETYRTAARSAQADYLAKLNNAIDDIVKSGKDASAESLRALQVDPIELYRMGGIDIKVDKDGKFTEIILDLAVDGRKPRGLKGEGLNDVIRTLIPNYNPDLSDVANLRNTIAKDLFGSRLQDYNLPPKISPIFHKHGALIKNPDVQKIAKFPLLPATEADAGFDVIQNPIDTMLKTKQYSVMTAEFPDNLSWGSVSKTAENIRAKFSESNPLKYSVFAGFDPKTGLELPRVEKTFFVPSGLTDEETLKRLLDWQKIRTGELKTELAARGYKFKDVKGSYGKTDVLGLIQKSDEEKAVFGDVLVENSVLVYGMTDADAMKFAGWYNQDSVLTSSGFVKRDGRIAPRVGMKIASTDDPIGLSGMKEYFTLIDYSGLGEPKLSKVVKFSAELKYDEKADDFIYESGVAGFADAMGVKLNELVHRIAREYNFQNGRTALHATSSSALANIIKKHFVDLHPSLKGVEPFDSSNLDDILEAIAGFEDKVAGDKTYPIQTIEGFVDFITDAFNASSQRNYQRNLPKMVKAQKEGLKQALVDVFDLNPEYADDMMKALDARAANWAKANGKTPAEWWYTRYSAILRKGDYSMSGHYLWLEGDPKPVWFSPLQQLIKDGLKDASYPDGMAVIKRLQALHPKKDELEVTHLYDWLETLTPEELAKGVEVPSGKKVITYIPSLDPNYTVLIDAGRAENFRKMFKGVGSDGVTHDLIPDSFTSPADALVALLTVSTQDLDQMPNWGGDYLTYLKNLVVAPEEQALYDQVLTGTDTLLFNAGVVMKNDDPMFSLKNKYNYRSYILDREDQIKLKAYYDAGRVDPIQVCSNDINLTQELIRTGEGIKLTPEMVLNYAESHELKMVEKLHAGNNAAYANYSLQKEGLETLREKNYFVLEFVLPDYPKYSGAHFDPQNVIHIRGFNDVPIYGEAGVTTSGTTTPLLRAMDLEEVQGDLQEKARDVLKTIRWDLPSKIKGNLQARVADRFLGSEDGYKTYLGFVREAIENPPTKGGYGGKVYLRNNSTAELDEEAGEIVRRKMLEILDSYKTSLWVSGGNDVMSKVDTLTTGLLSNLQVAALDELQLLYVTPPVDIVWDLEGAIGQIEKKTGEMITDLTKKAESELPDISENMMKVIGVDEKGKEIKVNPYMKWLQDWATPEEMVLIKSGGYKTPEVIEFLAQINRNELQHSSMFDSLLPKYPYTTSYPEVGYKRAIRKAVDDGQDAIFWPMGVHQDNRYGNYAIAWEQVSDTEWRVYQAHGYPITGATQTPLEFAKQHSGGGRLVSSFEELRNSGVAQEEWSESLWKAMKESASQPKVQIGQRERYKDFNSHFYLFDPYNLRHTLADSDILRLVQSAPKYPYANLDVDGQIQKLYATTQMILSSDGDTRRYVQDMMRAVDALKYSSANGVPDPNDIEKIISEFLDNVHIEAVLDDSERTPLSRAVSKLAFNGMDNEKSHGLFSDLMAELKNSGYDVDEMVRFTGSTKIIEPIYDESNLIYRPLLAGMENYYDSEMVQYFNKIGKPYGIEVKDIEIPKQDPTTFKSGTPDTIKVHAFIFKDNEAFKAWAGEPKPLFLVGKDDQKRAATQFMKEGSAIIWNFLEKGKSSPLDAFHELLHPALTDLPAEDWKVLSKWLGELPENQRVNITADEFYDLHTKNQAGTILPSEFEKYTRASENINNGVMRTIVESSDEFTSSAIRKVFQRIAQFIKNWYETIIKGTRLEVEVTPEVRKVFIKLFDKVPDPPADEVVKLTDDMKNFWEAFKLSVNPGNSKTLTQELNHARVVWTDPNAFLQSLKNIADTEVNPNVADYYLRQYNDMMIKIRKAEETILNGGATSIPSAARRATPIPTGKLPVEYQSWLSLQQESVTSLNRAINALVEWQNELSDSIRKAGAGDTSKFFFTQQTPEVWDTLEKWATASARDLNKMKDTVINGGEYAGKSVTGAIKYTNDAMIDYTQWNQWENYMRIIYPFWMFPSRSTTFWMKTLAEHPSIAMWYQKYMLMSEKSQHQAGLITTKGDTLPSFRGYVQIPGSNVWFNPTAPLSFRYVLNPLMGFTSGDNAGMYDDMETELDPLSSVIRELYRIGTDYGFQVSPMFQMMPAFKSLVGEENNQTILPALDLFPLNWRRAVLDKLKIKSPVARAAIAAEPTWKNYLIENEILKDTLTKIRIMDDEGEQYKVLMNVHTMLTTVDEFGSPARENNPDWVAYRTKFERGQLNQKYVSYFTGFYGKPWTDADAALLQLRIENNKLRTAINNEAQAHLFDLDWDAARRYDNYIHNVYETPEGALYNLRQAISWVTTDEGVEVTDPIERLRWLNIRLEEETNRDKMYNELAESRSLLEGELAAVPLGAAYEITQPIYDRYYTRNEEIRSRPEYAGLDDGTPWNPVNKPDEKILDHYRYDWFRDLRGTLPPYDAKAETYQEYKDRKEAWEQNFSKLSSDLAKKYKERIEKDMIKLFPMLGFGTVGMELDAPGTGLADRIIQQLMSETTVEDMDSYYKKNDTIHDALVWAWDELYLNKYWEAIGDKTGDERTIAVNRFHTMNPVESITPAMMAELILAHPVYSRSGWTASQIVSAYVSAPLITPEESEEEVQSNGEKQVDQAFKILGWADRGDEYNRFMDEIKLMGGSQVASDLELLYSTGGSSTLAQPKYADRLNALLTAIQQAAKSLGITAPTDKELVVRVEAGDLNDLYRKKAMERFGNDIFEISSLYYGLSYTAQKEFRQNYPEDFERIQSLPDFKKEFAAMYPLWAEFYAPNASGSTSDGGGGTGDGESSKKDKAPSGGSDYSGGGYSRGYSSGYSSNYQQTSYYQQYGMKDGFPQMGKRYTLEFRKLLSGYNIGKAGVAGAPIWPEEMMDKLVETLGELMAKEIVTSIETGEAISEPAEAFLEAVEANHPEWAGIINEVKEKTKGNPVGPGGGGGVWREMVD